MGAQAQVKLVLLRIMPKAPLPYWHRRCGQHSACGYSDGPGIYAGLEPLGYSEVCTPITDTARAMTSVLWIPRSPSVHAAGMRATALVGMASPSRMMLAATPRRQAGSPEELTRRRRECKRSRVHRKWLNVLVGESRNCGHF